MRPLFSHIICGRNDNYLGNFRQRLEMMLNFNCGNVEKTGNLEDYEVLMVDWNSDTPLREALNLNAAARKCVHFLEVPPDAVRQHDPGNAVINLGLAANVGLRRARGEMIIQSPSDVFFPYESIRALFSLFRNELPCPANIHDCYLGVPRFLIPWQASLRLTPGDLERYFLLHTAYLKFVGHNYLVSGGEGGFIASRKRVHEMHGFNETLVNWGGHDEEFALRMGQHTPVLKATFAGIFCYDMQQNPDLRAKEIKKNKWPEVLHYQVNSENWGLGQLDIQYSPALYRPSVDNSPELPPNTIFPVSGSAASGTPIRNGLASLSAKCGENVIAALLRFAGSRQPGRLRRYAGLLGIEAMLRRLSAYQAAASPMKQNWFVVAPELRGFYRQVFERFFNIYPEMDLSESSLHAAFAVIESLRRIGGGKFFFANARHRDLLALLASLDPTMEITFHDNGKSAAYTMSVFLNSRFEGVVQRVTGATVSIFERLREMELMGGPFDCILLDADFIREALPGVSMHLPSLLRATCAVIIKGKAESRAQLSQYLGELGLEKIGELPEIDVFARGLS